MGGSLGGSESESSQDSSFSQDVWNSQGNALQDLYSAASGLFGTTNQGMQNQIPAATNWMQSIQNQSQPYWQNQMEGGAYQDMALQDQLTNSLNQSFNTPSAMSDINSMIMGGSGNTYADAMKDQYVQDATTAQENMLENMDARASAAGMSGGSRHGNAIGQGMKDINQNLQRNMANTGFSTFDQDLDRKLDIAQQADSNTLERQQMLSGMIGNQQNAMSGGLNYGQNMQNLGMGQFSPYMMPQQAMSNYANVIGRPTVLGSGSSQAESSSKGSGAGFGM